eukprot:scaffold50494_cov18-Tisochrysis_lutea.AAC.1
MASECDGGAARSNGAKRAMEQSEQWSKVSNGAKLEPRQLDLFPTPILTSFPAIASTWFPSPLQGPAAATSFLGVWASPLPRPFGLSDSHPSRQEARVKERGSI